MPVTAGKRAEEISQREQYARGGVGRRYWDFRDGVALRHVIGPKVLDAGCGEGITLAKLVAAFPGGGVQGVDIDPRNIAVCRESGLPVQQADLTRLPFADGSFDTCVFMEVIEHLEEPEKVLSELARVLRPGGRLVIVYPVDWAMWLARVACLRFREAGFDPAHVRQWSARELKPVLRGCGLTATVCRGMPLPWPFMLHGLVVGRKSD